MTDDPLVAIVEKETADPAIAAIKDQGDYDRNRRIREADATTLAVPILAPPDVDAVREVRTDTHPDYQIRDLDDLLRERGFSAVERERVPRSWAVLGTVILGRFEDCPREAEVGEALLELHRAADTVLATEGIAGRLREPRIRVVAGEGETETIHREHGTAYAMDLAEVMFSPGNKAERRRMGKVIEPGEEVFDMFAGIGYFTLPMARAGADVTATERNPIAFRYLLENAVLNGVADRIDAFRTDCRSIRPRVDRVVMGYYDATTYLSAGRQALRPGGTLHLHDVAPADAPFAGAREDLAACDLAVADERIVKSHSPGMVHVVVDAVDRCA